MKPILVGLFAFIASASCNKSPPERFSEPHWSKDAWGRETRENTERWFSGFPHIAKLHTTDEVIRPRVESGKKTRRSEKTYSGKVLVTYKGSLQPGQRLEIQQILDYPTQKNGLRQKKSRTLIVLLREYQEGKVAYVDTGEVLHYDPGLETALLHFYPNSQRPRSEGKSAL